MKGSFRDRVLRAVRELEAQAPGHNVSREQLRQHLDINQPVARKKLATALGELVKAGRLENCGDGNYGSLAVEPGVPEKQAVMWAILRAKRLATVDNLAALAGVSRKYAQEWLAGLVKMELVAPISGAKRQGEATQYRLLKDPGPEPPRNEANAAKLRRLRAERKQEALNKLDAAFAAVAEARLAVCRLEEE